METDLCVESLAGPQPARAAALVEQFRVFTVDVAVDHRRVLPGNPPAEEPEFRPRWWRVADPDAD